MARKGQHKDLSYFEGIVQHWDLRWTPVIKGLKTDEVRLELMKWHPTGLLHAWDMTHLLHQSCCSDRVGTRLDSGYMHGMPPRIPAHAIHNVAHMATGVLAPTPWCPC